MKAPVTHLNLLQRSGPSHPLAWGLLAVLVVTVLGLGLYGGRVLGESERAMRQRDAVAAQLKDVQARLAALNAEQAKSAGALALRKELDELQPRARSAQLLLDAVRSGEGGRGEDFSRPLAALAGLTERGVWLTSVSVTSSGKQLELKGEAGNGAAVLRLARRANVSLQPLNLRLDTLEMQPTTAAAAPGATPGAVSFKLN